MSDHFSALCRNLHDNDHLQKAFNKYGNVNFIVHVVLYCEEFELTRYEQAYVGTMQSRYNICKICVTGTNGITLSDETRHKMSVIQLGRPSHNKGHKMSEESRRKMSASRLGRVGGMSGKKHSDAAKQKMSKAHKYRKELPENIAHDLVKSLSSLIRHTAAEIKSMIHLNIHSALFHVTPKTSHRTIHVKSVRTYQTSDITRQKLKDAWKKRKLVGVSYETRLKMKLAWQIRKARKVPQ
jgi:group I intron endonuclease